MDDLARTRLADLFNTTPTAKGEKPQELEWGSLRMKWNGPGVVRAVEIEFGKAEEQS